MTSHSAPKPQIQMGNTVERGDVIGYAHGIPYKTKMTFDMNMGDMDVLWP